MTFKQQQKIKSSIINTNNWLNVIFTIFNSLNFEFYLGSRLIIFSSQISFHNANCSSNKYKEASCKKLNEIVFESLLDPKIVIVITDANIKNNITSSISYIHFFSNLLKKILHHTVNIILTEVELFAIKYRINQAVQMQDVSYIIVITDTIYAVEKIFDLFMYLHQQQSIVISKKTQCILQQAHG